MPTECLEHDHGLTAPLDLHRTIGSLRRGSGDPCLQIVGADVWRATRTPGGPATVQLRHDARRDTVRARAWGPGAACALAGLADLLGDGDHPSRFTDVVAMLDTPEQHMLHDLSRRFCGVRIPRSGAVTEALVPVILEQRVTGLEARRSYRSIVRAWGEPAPGPTHLVDGLVLPPAPERLARTPAWAFHPHGVERARAEAIRRVCRYAHRMEEAAGMGVAEAHQRLTAVPGIGPWSAAEVALVALGDADAVSIGDYHLPNQIAWAFRRRPRGTDDEMLELLEPYRGHRGRVLRLVALSGISAPKFGPRRAVRPMRWY